MKGGLCVCVQMIICEHLSTHRHYIHTQISICGKFSILGHPIPVGFSNSVNYLQTIFKSLTILFHILSIIFLNLTFTHVNCTFKLKVREKKERKK